MALGALSIERTPPPRRGRVIGLGVVLVCVTALAAAVLLRNDLGAPPTSTVRSDQVQVSSVLRPINGTDLSVRGGPWNYLLDIHLAMPSADGTYQIDVYPYLAGASDTLIDFGQGLDSAGNVRGGQGITTGRNGAAVTQAHGALGKQFLGIIQPWTPEGFAFTGYRSDLQVRFAVAMTSSQLPLRADRFAVVVVYNEQRDGRSLAWAVVHPVRLQVATTP